MIAVALVMGSAAVAFLPPVSTYDAPGHFFRSVQIAKKHFRASKTSNRLIGGDLNIRTVRFVETLWASYWIHHDLMKFSDWAKISQEQPSDHDYMHRDFTNMAVYSPANYIPQSLGIALTRIFTRSQLWADRSACALNLLFYIFLIIFSIEILPAFQTSVLLIATTPFLLIQSATLNIDALNFAVPFCMLAIVWRLRSVPVANIRLLLAAVTCLAMWTALLKPPQIILVGLLYFIPQASFGSSQRRFAWLLTTLGLAAGLWFFWNGPYLGVDVHGFIFPTRPPVSEQKAYLMHHPTSFLRSLGTFMRRDFFSKWLWENWYSGAQVWPPEWLRKLTADLSWIFFLALLLQAGDGRKRDWRWGFTNLAFAAGLFSVMSIALWLACGIGEVDGIPYLGGRYLFLFLALLVIAWAEIGSLSSGFAKKYLVATGLLLNTVSLGAILTTMARRVIG